MTRRPRRNHSPAFKAKLLSFSRGSVYYLPRPVSGGDTDLFHRIDELHLDYPFARSRMLQWLLKGDWLEAGRLHVDALMQKMGIEAIYPEHLQTGTRSQNLSLAPPQAGGDPAQSGLGDGHNVCADGSRFCLSLCRRGVVKPEGSVVAAVDHDGGGLLHLSGRGGAGSLWKAWDIQHRPRFAIHLQLYGGDEEGRDRHLDGWKGRVARQRLRRANLAVDQMRRGLSARLKAVSEARADIGRYPIFYYGRRPH